MEATSMGWLLASQTHRTKGIERAPVCSQFSHRTEVGDADEAESVRLEGNGWWV